jgi:ribosome biogenesis GTPase A
MAKGKRQILEELAKVDVILIVGDARAAARSVAGAFYQKMEAKKKAYVFNKSDLADERAFGEIRRAYSLKGAECFFTDCLAGKGIKEVKDFLKSQQGGFRFSRETRAMACGIPNVGKSMLINAIASRSANKAENRPAVTRALKWIRVEGSFYLLDTPGILEPSFQSKEDGAALAAIGCVKDTGYDEGELSLSILAFLKDRYPDLLRERYRLDSVDSETLDLFYAVGRKRGFLAKGGEVDALRTAQAIIGDVKNGRVGRIAFDFMGE